MLYKLELRFRFGKGCVRLGIGIMLLGERIGNAISQYGLRQQRVYNDGLRSYLARMQATLDALRAERAKLEEGSK